MQEAKLDPNVVSATTLGSARARRPSSGSRPYLASLIATAKLEPTVILYSSGISACEKGERWQEALVLLSEMWKAKMDPNP
ncbi:unnamed protein product [Prorocentrum cordatum]|uniref:Pentatricopeptide repeat-containing protein n=1 Tax=Prorocentrum cordatum TaxID=2364126 RepID=A0ABN9Y225_9DINO|nr:unnamed protein product [Polarella glacialis]